MSHDGRVRVLWLTKGLGPGGAERLLLSFAQLADHERFDLHAAYLLPWKDHLTGPLESHGVRTHCLHGGRAGDPRWLRRLRHLVDALRIDVVHGHSPLVAAQARLALRRRSVGLVGTEHNVWTSHNPLTRAANRATLHLEDHTFAVSEEVRDSIGHRRRDRVEVLLHGVDVDAISARRDERAAAREELGIGADTLVVVTVANLRATKDYPVLLEATEQLVSGGADVCFLSVGQGPLEAELRARRDASSLGARFRFLGYREDPVRVLAAGDVFCLSSRFEGLSIALLEAMAMGLAPVVTRVGGLPSVITDGVDGSLVEPGDPAGLARAIGALRDPEARARLARGARARVDDFSMTTAVARQQDLYRELAR